MTYTIDLHPEAIREINDSYQWYEDRLEGLGHRFMNAVDKQLSSIARHPELYAKKKGNYRESLVKGFPFAIIYEILPKQEVVFVSYVFHSKRNPRLKYKR